MEEHMNERLERKSSNIFSLELEEDYQFHPELAEEKKENSLTEKELEKIAVKLRKIDYRLKQEEKKSTKSLEKKKKSAEMFYEYLFHPSNPLSIIGFGFFVVFAAFASLAALDLNREAFILFFKISSIAFPILLPPIIGSITEKLLKRYRRFHQPEKEIQSLEKELYKKSVTKLKEKFQKEKERFNKIADLQYKNWNLYRNLKSELERVTPKEENQKETEEVEKIKTEKESKEIAVERQVSEAKKRIQELLGLLQSLEPKSLDPKRVKISFDQLMVSVKDHYEIDPDYRSYLSVIDLSGIDLDNVNVSGLDWSKTNALIDPQRVWKKNLNGGIYCGNFDGYQLKGCHLSDTTIMADDTSKLAFVRLNEVAEYNENTTFSGFHVYDEEGKQIEGSTVKGISKTKRATHR